MQSQKTTKTKPNRTPIRTDPDSEHLIVLNAQDWDTFHAALINPPAPNAVLKRAFAAYKQMNIQSDIEDF